MELVVPETGAAGPEPSPVRPVATAAQAARPRSAGALFVAAGLSGALALALGAVAVAQALDRDDSLPGLEVAGARQAIAVLSKPGAERIPLRGSEGRVVLAVGPLGRAVLVLDGLEQAPPGRTYQAWRLDGGESASLAVFSGAEVAVRLAGLLDRGDTVAVTLEREGGAETRTGRILSLASV